ncbi:MAG: hypothetical protein Q9226_008269 [Calogaya cf. arnoldii]
MVSARGTAIVSTATFTEKPVRGFASYQKSTPHLKDSGQCARLRSPLSANCGPQIQGYENHSPGQVVPSPSTQNATLLKTSKMDPETRHRSAALEVPRSKGVYDQRVYGTNGPLQATFESLGATSEDGFTPAVDPQAEDDEEETTNLSDDPDNLTNALLAFLDAQIQGQPKKLADSATQIRPPGETRDDAANELTRGSITHLTANAGTLATVSAAFNLPLEGLSTRLELTSQANTTKVSETKEEVALQAQTATDAADYNPQNVNMDSATSEGVGKTQAAGSDLITAPQASGSSDTQEFWWRGLDRQQESLLERLKTPDQSRGPGRVQAIPAVISERGCTARVDAVEKHKAYERVIARMICGDIEAIVRLKEVVNELWDQSKNEKFMDIYDDIAISKSLALRNLASYPATMSRLA